MPSLRAAVGEALARLPEPLHARVPAGVRAEVRYRTRRYLPGDLGYRVPVPSHRVGQVIGPPDLVQMGVTMAGSRWWIDQLIDHPGVSGVGAGDQAARYFARYGTDGFGPDDIDRFHRLFPRRPGQVAAHWCPDGLAHHWVAPLLAQAAPKARLVVVLRDPIERLRAALAHLPEGTADHIGSALGDAVDRGRYGRQLRRLLSVYPTDQVHVVQFEACAEDPVAALSAAYRFAGLEDSHRPAALAAAFPPHPQPGSPPLDPDTFGRLCDVFDDDVADLLALCPEVEVARWPNFADRHRDGHVGRQ